MGEHPIVYTLDHEKTLRWLEPFHGGLNINDTGLGNRLLHWEVGFELLRHNNYSHTLLLQIVYWREFEFMYMPETKAILKPDFEHDHFHNLKFKTVFEINPEKVYPATPLTYDVLKERIETGNFKFKEDNHLYADFGFNFINEIPLAKGQKNRGLELIKLRDKGIENAIRSKVHNLVAIHIRRGEGVTKTEENLNTLPEKFRSEYDDFIKEEKAVQDEAYYFVEDSVYFELIDRILSISPDQKFFISSDMDDRLLQNYKDRYGDKVLLQKDFYEEIFNLYKEGYEGEWWDFRKQAITNLIDLFSLAYSSLIIKAPASTFSETAGIIGRTPRINIEEGITKAVDLYLTLDFNRMGIPTPKFNNLI